ncbi:MAG: penicillin-binding protein activator LpoB [Pseudomonadota bacterium]
MLLSQIYGKKLAAGLACVSCAAAVLSTLSALAASPKIAVTDLTYEEKVSEYFRVVRANSKSSFNAHDSERETERGYAMRSSLNARNESNYYESEGSYTYINRGELRTYTADLKGVMLKGGGIRLINARPYLGRPTDQIYDIISRIKQGRYAGADYVLFGTVSNIDFRQESNALALGSSSTASLSLDLVADFSLIDTRSYEVKAAFSASGSGADTRILTRAGDRVIFNRGKVMQETSRSLADAAYAELMTQLGMPMADRKVTTTTNTTTNRPAAAAPAPPPVSEPVIIYK